MNQGWEQDDRRQHQQFGDQEREHAAGGLREVDLAHRAHDVQHDADRGRDHADRAVHDEHDAEPIRRIDENTFEVNAKAAIDEFEAIVGDLGIEQQEFDTVGGLLFAISGVISLVSLILWILLMIKAYQNEWYKVPLVGDIALQKSQQP